MNLRSLLYAAARKLGDYNAIKHGPVAVGKRIVRKAAYKGFSKTLGKLLK
jgi:hypothetical protein